MQLRVLLWLAVCLLSACAPVAEHNSQLDTIYQRNSLRVGLLHGPTSYFIGVDGPAGFEYELAQTLAQRLDVELELFPRCHMLICLTIICPTSLSQIMFSKIVEPRRGLFLQNQAAAVVPWSGQSAQS